MATFADVESQEPEFAARVRAAFDAHAHKFLATLRADGAPRISGTEVELGDDELHIGSMPGARKARDLLRDARVAIHSPTVDPPEGDESSWAGEAKVGGRAVEVPSDDASHRFRIDVDEVVHTAVDGDALRIRSWHRGRGAQERRRS